VVADIALIVTAIGVLAAVYSLRQSYRERLRQFEAMYVQRYWSILDQLSLDALSESSQDRIIDTDQKAIRSYLLLCEDELEMRKNGYIGDSTYRLWAAGIRDQVAQSMFGEVWDQVSIEPTFPYQHLKELLRPGEEYEPLKMHIMRRWLRGLAGIGGV
jgi:hypothetical protein